MEQAGITGDSVEDLPGDHAAVMAHLVRTQQPEVDRFLELRGRFWDVVRSFGDVPEEFVVPEWRRASVAVAEVWDPVPPVGFLRQADVLNMMHVHGTPPWLAYQTGYVETMLDKRALLNVLPESAIGYPLTQTGNLVTSHQNIHVLTHLLRWLAKTGLQTMPQTVVEWGGGYGTLALLYRRLALSSDDVPRTHVLIDLPLFAALQWLYLSAVLGTEHVHIPESRDDFARGKVNIVPVGRRGIVGPRADLFVSTWALSECTQKLQKVVAKDLRWFGARRFLLAYQKASDMYPAAELLALRVPRPFEREACGYIPYAWYVFR